MAYRWVDTGNSPLQTYSRSLAVTTGWFLPRRPNAFYAKASGFPKSKSSITLYAFCQEDIAPACAVLQTSPTGCSPHRNMELGTQGRACGFGHGQFVAPGGSDVRRAIAPRLGPDSQK